MARGGVRLEARAASSCEFEAAEHDAFLTVPPASSPAPPAMTTSPAAGSVGFGESTMSFTSAERGASQPGWKVTSRAP